MTTVLKWTLGFIRIGGALVIALFIMLVIAYTISTADAETATTFTQKITSNVSH